MPPADTGCSSRGLHPLKEAFRAKIQTLNGNKGATFAGNAKVTRFNSQVMLLVKNLASTAGDTRCGGRKEEEGKSGAGWKWGQSKGRTWVEARAGGPEERG